MKTKWMVTGLVALCGMAQAAYVTIGNAGNAADTTGYGAVSYTYQISDHEVTIAEFQQASGAGSGNEGSWSGSVGTNAPASLVTLYEAMKYCNWLTSGNVSNGVYQFSGGVYQSMLSRDNILTNTAYSVWYAVPTDDEWYKAAYYTGNDGDLWSLYANGTDVTPTVCTTNGWNYDGTLGSVWAVTYGAEEQNSTYDMMGNVWEWIENTNGVLRGGAHINSAMQVSSLSSSRITTSPLSEYSTVGFRPIAIPEPMSVMMIVLGGLLIAGYRRFFGRA